MSQDRFARGVAIGGVIATLVAGGANYLVAQRAIDQASAETAEHLALLREQGPVMVVTPTLYVLHTDGSWELLPGDDPVSRQETGDGKLVVKMTVVNEGRFQGTVTDFGLGTGPNTYVSPSEAKCVDPASPSVLSLCKLPRVIEVQGEETFYFDVSPQMLSEVTCNDYLDSGFQAVVIYRGTPDYSEDWLSQKFEGFSTC